MRFLLVTALLAGCASPAFPGTDDGEEPAADDDTGASRSDSGATVDETSAPSTDSEAPNADTAVADTTPPEPECYREAWNPSASLADLKSGYTSTKWRTTALEALNRRYPDGFALLDAMKDDADLSRFANPSSFPALMESIDTMCHEEGHGWDFNAALKTPGKHVYWMRKDLQLQVPKTLGYFARSELLTYIKDDATSLYDGTYLKGTQGSYDFIFLGDELTQYINGLACVTTVGSETKVIGTSFRDGAAAHLLYLEWYLNKARTKYPALYTKMKDSAELQKFVRYAWARGHFWTEASKIFPTFGIKDKQIWEKVNAKENLAEIEQFTGDPPAVVACKP
jgi:hypothetical protein